MTLPTIRFKRLRPEQDADIPLPMYMTPQAAGMDIYVALETEKTLEPGTIFLASTGFAMAIPSGYEAQIRPRSGLAVRHGIGLINAPGTIDADYRGEIGVILINHGSLPFIVRRGDRIAQMVVHRVCRVAWDEGRALSATQRDRRGFGHTR